MNDLEVPNTVMLHAEFEVSTLNSMAVREIIRLDYKQIRKIRKTRRLDH